MQTIRYFLSSETDNLPLWGNSDLLIGVVIGVCYAKKVVVAMLFRAKTT